MPALEIPGSPKPLPPPVLDFDNEDTHWHRCPGCRAVWAHTNDDNMTWTERIQAHLCPQCGTWTGAQVDVDDVACKRFLETTPLQIVGAVRCTSPQNGF